MKDETLKWFALLASLQLALVAKVAEGDRMFNRCSLALELHSRNIPRDELPRWVYIARELSSYQTHVVSDPDIEGFRHYGIFQIGEQYWCKSTKGTKNHCKVDCFKLLSDNIQPSLDCAQIILTKQGWSAWKEGVVSVEDCFETQAESVNATAAGGSAGRTDSRPATTALVDVSVCSAVRKRMF